MSNTTLYAWARPLSQMPIPVMSHLDHTWVTNSPVWVNPDHQADPPKGSLPPECYWYCWGAPHIMASHALDSEEASLSIAQAISPNNVPATPPDGKEYWPSDTSGAIVYYGLDGVCHHVANQVLVATGSPTKEPIRVQQAKGYSLSTFFFNTYGLNTAKWDEICKKHASEIKLPGDDFIPFLKEYVPSEHQETLLLIRGVAQAAIVALRGKVVEKDFDFYPELFLIISGALEGAKKLLGHTVFDQLFPDFDKSDTAWLKPLI